jgi:hypothetical protein
MNKRINELAIQAGGIWRGGYVEQANGDSVWTDKKFVVDVDTEQFAELMIIEFSDVVKQTANEITTAGFKGDATHDEVMLCVNGALTVLDNIRKRFGGE